MSMLYNNSKTIWEMTPEERKITLIIMGIMILIAVVVGIYYFFKSKKDN